jgi:hypothetical protein
MGYLEPPVNVELPPIVSRPQWLEARLRLLAREKELGRPRNAVTAERRRLTMAKIERDYVFDGPAGGTRLLELFGGCRQLTVHHSMFDPAAFSAAEQKLSPAASAKTVRMKNGKAVFTDGPFAETKEQVGGFHLIDCKDLNEAMSIAARIPTLTAGTVEERCIEKMES